MGARLFTGTKCPASIRFGGREGPIQFALNAPATPQDILIPRARACLGYVSEPEGK